MNLYRAVSREELEDVRSRAGGFRDSTHLTGEKGFFYSKDDATKMAASFSTMLGEPHFVVMTVAPPGVVDAGREHIAAQEGLGVYLRVDDLESLTPAIEVTS
jgi:hypothetical protein